MKGYAFPWRSSSKLFLFDTLYLLLQVAQVGRYPARFKARQLARFKYKMNFLVEFYDNLN